MIPSYLITNKSNLAQLEHHVSTNYSGHQNFFSFQDFVLFIKSEEKMSFEKIFVETKDGIFGVLGEFYNKKFCQSLLPSHKNNLDLEDNTTLFIELYNLIGSEAFVYLDGCFSVLHLTADGSLCIFTNATANHPVYYYKSEDSLWITNEVKLLRNNHLFNLSLKEFDVFRPSGDLPSDFTIFQQIQKVPAGRVLHCSPQNRVLVKELPDFNKKALTQTSSPLGLDASMEKLDELLSTAIDNYLKYSDSQAISIALSGGIDSCIVAAYARKLRPSAPIHTFTFGSHAVNEFKYAKLCSARIDAHHHEIFFDESTFLEGYLKTIYHNEMFDGVFAEVHAIMFLVYEQAKPLSKMILNGFNADNLLGGLLDPNTPKNEINKALLGKLEKTKWTGEYNPFLANSYGLTEGGAFLNPQVVSFISTLEADLKISNMEAKYILKLLAEKKDLLPKEIIWRKKVRLEEGCASEQIFSHFLKLPPNFYRKKHEFAYNVFQHIFSYNVDPKNIDLLEIRNSLL